MGGRAAVRGTSARAAPLAPPVAKRASAAWTGAAGASPQGRSERTGPAPGGPPERTNVRRPPPP